MLYPLNIHLEFEELLMGLEMYSLEGLTKRADLGLGQNNIIIWKIGTLRISRQHDIFIHALSTRNSG